MKKSAKYDLGKIMRQAWELFQQNTRPLVDGTLYHFWSFSECLKQAWKNAKQEGDAEYSRTGGRYHSLSWNGGVTNYYGD